VRIGEPARKHGVIDADIRHAVRTAMRRVVLKEDLTMLIGPATTGHYWRSASSTSTGTTRSSSTQCHCDRSSTGSWN